MDDSSSRHKGLLKKDSLKQNQYIYCLFVFTPFLQARLRKSK